MQSNLWVGQSNVCDVNYVCTVAVLLRTTYIVLLKDVFDCSKASLMHHNFWLQKSTKSVKIKGSKVNLFGGGNFVIAERNNFYFK